MRLAIERRLGVPADLIGYSPLAFGGRVEVDERGAGWRDPGGQAGVVGLGGEAVEAGQFNCRRSADAGQRVKRGPLGASIRGLRGHDGRSMRIRSNDYVTRNDSPVII